MKRQDKITIKDKFDKKINCIILAIIEIKDRKYIIYKYEDNLSFEDNLLASEILEEDDKNYKLGPITSDEIWEKLELKYKNLYTAITDCLENV